MREETEQMKEEVKPTGANSSTALEPIVLPGTSKKLFSSAPAIYLIASQPDDKK